MKLIKTIRHYQNEKGEDKKTIEFYLEVEGVAKPIQIMPKVYGEKGTSFNALNLVAEYRKDYGRNN